MKDINTLVFEGGSVKGLAYVGALQVLDLYSQQQENGKPFLEQIDRVAGTSAGSIMALLIALGLNLKQINVIMQNTSFASFADNKTWYAWGSLGKGAAVYNQGYLCEGKAFLTWVENLLETYAGDKNVTFDELKKGSGKKELHVYAVCLNTNKIVTFNATETPNVSVALAVRMSMSIPVFFKPVRVNETTDTNGKLVVELDETSGTTYYVDGGVKINYPYAPLKENAGLQDEQILGFKVDSSEEIFANAASQQSGQYLAALNHERTQMTNGFGAHLISRTLTTLMSSQNDVHNANASESFRTIRCWDCDVATLDFKLSKKKIAKLLMSGQDAAHAFITKLMPLTQTQPSISQTVSDTKPHSDMATSQAYLPNTESISSEDDFAERYIKSEEERTNRLLQRAQDSLRSRGTALVDDEEQEQLEALNIDQNRLQETQVTKDYGINMQLVIEGTVGEAGNRLLNFKGKLPAGIDANKFLENQQKLYQTAIDKRTKAILELKKGGKADKLSNELFNWDFNPGSDSASVTEHVSVLIRKGMYSPTPLIPRAFHRDAKNFLSELKTNSVYREDIEMKAFMAALEVELSKGNNPDQAQRNEIREIIKDIESHKEIIDLQKKTSVSP